MGAPRDPHRIQARTEIEIHSPASKKGTTAARLIDVMPAAPAAAQETEQRGFPNTIVQRSFSHTRRLPRFVLACPQSLRLCLCGLFCWRARRARLPEQCFGRHSGFTAAQRAMPALRAGAILLSS